MFDRQYTYVNEQKLEKTSKTAKIRYATWNNSEKLRFEKSTILSMGFQAKIYPL